VARGGAKHRHREQTALGAQRQHPVAKRATAGTAANSTTAHPKRRNVFRASLWQDVSFIAAAAGERCDTARVPVAAAPAAHQEEPEQGV